MEHNLEQNIPIHTWHRGDYEISTDKTRIDLQVVINFLATSYWAASRPPATTQRGIEHSLCFGMYHGDEQIGFARVTTDYATIAYIGDVFVVEGYRGQGLAQWLMECIIAHPELQGLRRWILTTRDAHGLYDKIGFGPLVKGERWMERAAPWAYDQPGLN
jgi:GNAT superfamily N-acetyltransferase